jgi:two-component system sensor histidine kinase UhpB
MVMETIDLGAAPGRRLDHPGHGPAAALGHGFNAMLERLEDERNLSTSRALAAQEEERRRIAQELHDEVGQSLTAVLLGLKSVLDQAPAQTAVQLEPVQATARASLEEVRRIAQRLRPGVLEDLGLLNSLSSLASDLTQHSQVSVTRGFAPGLPSLPRETELVLYRVAQEALTNVARHAGASHVELGVSRQGSAVVLRVADDGRGIRAPEGAGIQGMRERARMVGGRLDIHGRAGGGTEVTLVVPAASADVDGHPAGATA